MSDTLNISNFQLLFIENFWYILKRFAAKIPASSPPVPALTSKMTFLWSSLSFGKIANSNFLFNETNSFSNILLSSFAISWRSISDDLSFNIKSKSSNSFFFEFINDERSVT